MVTDLNIQHSLSVEAALKQEPEHPVGHSKELACKNGCSAFPKDFESTWKALSAGSTAHYYVDISVFPFCIKMDSSIIETA